MKMKLIALVLLVTSACLEKANAATYHVGFDSGDGAFTQALPDLSAVKSISVTIQYLSALDGSPITGTPGTFDIQSLIAGDTTVLGVQLPTSYGSWDFGTFAYDPSFGVSLSPGVAGTNATYSFTQADLQRAKTYAPGSYNYADARYDVSTSALDTVTRLRYGWQDSGYSDGSTTGVLIIVTDPSADLSVPEPASFALLGIGALTLIRRKA